MENHHLYKKTEILYVSLVDRYLPVKGEHMLYF